MKIAIVEDENYWKERTAKIIRKFYGLHQQVDVFGSGEAYLRSEDKYDLSFVDIELPGIDGFETISRATKDRKEKMFIIMTTHLELSRKGYYVNAFRYVDKEHLEYELYEAMKSAEAIFGRDKKISVRVVKDGERDLILKNILYVETIKDYILIHTTHGEFRCDISMKDMEEKLGDKFFFRCHHAYIVNLDEVRSFDNIYAIMSNGEKLQISQRKYRTFKKAYINRQFECANA